MSQLPAGYRSSAPAETSPPTATGLCFIVRAPAELAEHLAIRQRVFVEEQRLFSGSDGDERDKDPATTHVLALWQGRPAGAVRLYPVDDRGLWKGDRLAVLPGLRQHRMGELLVRFAVRTAGERGGKRMIAYVQLSNVAFFEQLGWNRVGDPVEYVGRPHQQMEIDPGG